MSNELGDLSEATVVLELKPVTYSVDAWFRQSRNEEGNLLEEAVQESIQEGIAIGEQKGKEAGKEEGIQLGMVKGMDSKASEIAKSMLKDQEPIEKIARWTGLRLDAIKKLQG